MFTESFKKEVAECHAYLATGGLGEVMGITHMYAEMGAPKVQNDTALEWALLELAQETLLRRSGRDDANAVPDNSPSTRAEGGSS